MRKQNILLVLAGTSIVGIASAASMIPPISLSLGFEFTTKTVKNTTKCYNKVNQPVTAADGSNVVIQNGNCDVTNISSMGKAGQLKYFNLTGLRNIDLGLVSEKKGELITLPAPDDKNALLVSFIPSNPQGSRIVPTAQLRGKKVQAIIRTVPLTKELAVAEDLEWSEGQLLLELWGRTFPSVKGTSDFVQFFNMIVPASAIGAQFRVDVSPEGSVALMFRAKDDAGKDVIAGNETNISSQKP